MAGRQVFKKKERIAVTKSERSKLYRQSPLGHACTRVIERIEARLGKLVEATTIFQKARDVSNGGVLLTLPALLANGLLKHSEKRFYLPKGFYGIRHVFITLSFIVLLRIKSIEAIQYLSPGELGRIIGSDRVPEIKTIRRKLGILAHQNKADLWSGDLSKDWLKSDGELSGLLYVDGHVRLYHGEKTKLPKRYVSREKLCLRGMTDYWLNNALGQPYFVVTTALNSGMLSVLKEKIIPRILEEIPEYRKKEQQRNPEKSVCSIVFDREGYSPEFMKEMWEKHRISCYTYKKYPGGNWNDNRFTEQEVRLHSGEIVKMKIGEKATYLGKTLIVRELRKLSESGHQTAIITTDRHAKPGDIAANMFARWSQENFFKYMQEHFGIDRLIEYETTPIDETTKVVNPEYRRLESGKRSIRQKLGRKMSQFGALTLELSDEQRSEEDEKWFKKSLLKKVELRETIEFYQKKLEDLKERQKGVITHIPMSKLPDEEKFKSLSTEKKHIMDMIKMIAYRAETAMALMIEPDLTRRKETRALLRQIYATEIDLDPDEENNILNVQLHSLSNERSNKIASNICEKLNETETMFPGTNMKIIYKLVSS